jgi:hypothetical protein
MSCATATNKRGYDSKQKKAEGNYYYSGWQGTDLA